MKRGLLAVSIISLGVAIAGWFVWQQLLLTGSGPRGENWEAWSASIDAVWMIIPAAFAISVITAAASLFAKPKNTTGVIVAVVVVAVAIAVAGWFAFVLLHLRIS